MLACMDSSHREEQQGAGKEELGLEGGHEPGRVELAVCDTDSKGPPPHTQGWAGRLWIEP